MAASGTCRPRSAPCVAWPARPRGGRDTPFEQQHGIGGVINGLETRKAADIHRLLAGTSQPGPASDYIGPTKA